MRASSGRRFCLPRSGACPEPARSAAPARAARENRRMQIEKFPSALMHTIGFSEVLRTDAEAGSARVRFIARPEFAHSNGTVVQGGFVTAWLDCSMAVAVHAKDPGASLASLELKVSFLDRAEVTTFEAEARILRWGRSVVFLDADLFTLDGRLIARASSTGKLVRPQSQG
jgi:acyl-coenzyme A thioesterase PaaI-like protein